MTLVDTSIWIHHLRRGNARLGTLLEGGRALVHPWVRGELSMGMLRNRAEILALLGDIAQAPVATDDEVAGMVEREQLWGRGIGWIEAHLLASARLAGAVLWMRDRRLQAAAGRLGVLADPH